MRQRLFKTEQRMGWDLAVADELDVHLPYHDDAQALVRGERLRWERRLLQHTQELKVADPWVGQRGLGLLGLGQLIGEAGDLSRFPTVAKLWTWFGVGLVKDEPNGGYSRQVRYSRPRRAVLSQVGTSAIRAGGDLYHLYLQRKEFEYNKHHHLPELRNPGLYHNRAKRYLEKYLLRWLWREWNKEKEDECYEKA
jgi:hypothetical protein